MNDSVDENTSPSLNAVENVDKNDKDETILTDNSLAMPEKKKFELYCKPSGKSCAADLTFSKVTESFDESIPALPKNKKFELFMKPLEKSCADFTFSKAFAVEKNTTGSQKLCVQINNETFTINNDSIVPPKKKKFELFCKPSGKSADLTFSNATEALDESDLTSKKKKARFNRNSCGDITFSNAYVSHENSSASRDFRVQTTNENHGDNTFATNDNIVPPRKKKFELFRKPLQENCSDLTFSKAAESLDESVPTRKSERKRVQRIIECDVSFSEAFVSNENTVASEELAAETVDNEMFTKTNSSSSISSDKETRESSFKSTEENTADSTSSKTVESLDESLSVSNTDESSVIRSDCSRLNTSATRENSISFQDLAVQTTDDNETGNISARSRNEILCSFRQQSDVAPEDVAVPTDGESVDENIPVAQTSNDEIARNKTSTNDSEARPQNKKLNLSRKSLEKTSENFTFPKPAESLDRSVRNRKSKRASFNCNSKSDAASATVDNSAVCAHADEKEDAAIFTGMDDNSARSQNEIELDSPRKSLEKTSENFISTKPAESLDKSVRTSRSKKSSLDRSSKSDAESAIVDNSAVCAHADEKEDAAIFTGVVKDKSARSQNEIELDLLRKSSEKTSESFTFTKPAESLDKSVRTRRSKRASSKNSSSTSGAASATVANSAASEYASETFTTTNDGSVAQSQNGKLESSRKLWEKTFAASTSSKSVQLLDESAREIPSSSKKSVSQSFSSIFDETQFSSESIIKKIFDKNRNCTTVREITNLKPKRGRTRKNVDALDDSIMNLPKTPVFPKFDWYCNQRFYDYLIKKLQPKYGIKTNREVVKLAKYISVVVEEVISMNENYHDLVRNLKITLFRRNVIYSHLDFHVYCENYMPVRFRDKSIPMIQPVGWPMNAEFDPDTIDDAVEPENED